MGSPSTGTKWAVTEHGWGAGRCPNSMIIRKSVGKKGGEERRPAQTKLPDSSTPWMIPAQNAAQLTSPISRGTEMNLVTKDSLSPIMSEWVPTQTPSPPNAHSWHPGHTTKEAGRDVGNTVIITFAVRVYTPLQRVCLLPEQGHPNGSADELCEEVHRCSGWEDKEGGTRPSSCHSCLTCSIPTCFSSRLLLLSL